MVQHYNAPDRLVSPMKGIVEIDAGQNRKNISLQECHQQFKCGQRNGQRQRHDAADPSDCAPNEVPSRATKPATTLSVI
jgi:hypothetical protein